MIDAADRYRAIIKLCEESLRLLSECDAMERYIRLAGSPTRIMTYTHRKLLDAHDKRMELNEEIKRLSDGLPS